MRPVSLRIENFGPYTADPVVIDFAQLDRLFLVAGDTGAGKTSIFDAMCFALYGQPLGTREPMAVRSQHAAEDQPTLVELVFQCRGGTWKVRRAPAQLRRKLRGSGVTTSDATAELWHGHHAADGALTWEPVNLKRQGVDDKIRREILGLSPEEFSKILVLPQGEFQRFLEMDTKDRKPLLRTLFPTEEHERIAALAKEDAAQVKGRLEELEQRMTRLREVFDPDAFEANESRLQDELVPLVEAETSAETALREASRAQGEATELVRAFDDLAATIARLEQLEARRSEVEARRAELEAARRAGPVLQQLDERQKCAGKLEKAREAEREAEARLEAAQQRVAELRPEREGLPGREARLRDREEARRQLAARCQALRELIAKAEAVAKAEQFVREGEGRVVQADQALVAAESALAELEPVEAERAGVQAKLADARERVAKLALLKDATDGIEAWAAKSAKVAREIEALRTAAANAQAREAEAAAAVEDAQARLRADAALLVAADLTDGQPCPACGSLDHPRPAKGRLADDDLAELVAARESALDACRKASASARDAVTKAEENERLQRELSSERLQKLEAAGFATPAAWRTEHDRAVAEAAALAARDRTLAGTLAKRPSLAKELESKREDADGSRRALGQLKEALASLEGERATCAKAAGNPDDAAVAATAADDELRRIDEDITAERRAIEDVRAANASASEELVRRTEAKVAAERSRSALDEELAVRAEACASALVAESFADEASVRAASRDVVRQQALERDIDAWQREVSESEGRRRTLSEQVSGRDRPDLAALATAVDAATAARKEATEARQAGERRLQDLRDHLKQWSDLLDEHRTIGRENEVIVRLARDLNGEDGLKLDFATWVLGWWLERALERASRRLRSLSDGRYAFRLNQDQRDGRSRSGLEIDVWDARTGATRSVRTLSGGEKFLASLSLALGLSDVIQERAGGIELDTLFIDEGFGSLDADALERALGVLDEIGGQRTVGVISHVDALKRAIPCKLLVKKGPRGSTVEPVLS